MSICRHCKRKPADRARGLCRDCYYTPHIRQRYEPVRGGHPANEETMEDLERLIAERLPTMPRRKAGEE